MSILTLQYGQCGNQIGQALFESLYDDIVYTNDKNLAFKTLNADYYSDSLEKWFHINSKGGWEARNFLIDTEDKVVSGSSKSKNFKYPNIIAKAYGGAANNWAYGYNYKSNLLLQEVMDSVRKEAERCDFINSFFNILSSAGGTGSGVGSRIITALHEEYPSKIILNAVILPYSNGEVVTQNFNNLLTLCTLYSETDAIVLFENDRIHYTCNKILEIGNTKFSDINKIIANQLLSVIQPMEKFSLPSIVAQLACHPSYKFLHIKSAPYINNKYVNFEPAQKWNSLIQSIGRNRYTMERTPKFKKNVCLGSILLTRGGLTPNVSEVKQLQDLPTYASWLPTQSRFSNYHQVRELYNFPKSATLVTNSQHSCLSIDSILEDAWNLYTSEAYLHHYKKFGINNEYFLKCFEKLETVVQDYVSL